MTPTRGQALVGGLPYARLPHPGRPVGAVFEARAVPGFAAANVAGLVAGSAVAAGLLSGAGVLLGLLTRNATSRAPLSCSGTR